MGPPILFKFGQGRWFRKLVTLGCCRRGKPSYTSHILSEKNVYGISGSNIYGCGRIYLKNEATFGFDQNGKLFFLEGMDLRTGNFGGELLNL
jgi:hypothetical protein